MALVMSCSEAVPSAAQLNTVDSLVTATDAAVLTLNELDQGRYDRMDTLFQQHQARFLERFKDTLDPNSAHVLGDQFLQLRSARQLGEDHVRVMSDIAAASERLRALRTDLANGAIDTVAAAAIITNEERRHTALLDAVRAVIANYRSVQLAWDRRVEVDSLLMMTTAP
jgi:hypothetical protein